LVISSSLELRTEILFDMEAEVVAQHDVGAAPFGKRKIYIVGDGMFAGPELRGKVLPGGADWLLKASNGISELDVRATLVTDDGQLIYTYYRGIYYTSQEVKKRMDSGEDVQASEYYFRTTPRFETGSARYEWLNRVIAVGVGQKTATGISYRVYRVL